MDEEPGPAEARVTLHRPASGWIGGLLAAILIGALAAAFSILGVACLFACTWGVALLLLTLSGWMLLVANYVWRDCQAKRNWLVEIEPGELSLDLPAGRSLMEAGRRVKRLLKVSEVSAVETRLEAFRMFGMVNMQRNYGLRLKSGDLIVLGEDRALASGLLDATIGRFVDTIRLRTGLPLKDLGMVEGKGGVLGVLFTSVPVWNTPALPSVRQAVLWRNAALTGGMVGFILLTGFLLSMAI